MDIKERLEKIGKLIKDFTFSGQPPTPPTPAPAPAPQKMGTDYTLQDGTTVVTVDKLEVGGTATVAGAPAPDGKHTLQDGTAITVAGGVITAVEAAAPAPPQEMNTPAQMREELKKFADESAGTPQIGKLATIVRALFEYNFGWQIQDEQAKQQKAAAIEVWKAGFAAQEAKIEKMQTVIAEQQALIVEMAQQSATPPAERVVVKAPEEMTNYEKLKHNRGI